MKTIENWYSTQVANQKLTLDNHQLEIIKKFDIFIMNTSRQNYITRLFQAPHKLGFYIYGDVGRGKTMLTNQLFSHITSDRKLRIHFHQFMLTIQEMSNNTKHKTTKNSLESVAREIKLKYKYILLDEFHISDIGTAMIIKNVMGSLFDNGIYVITSSNFAPEQLYKDGLMYERFLPCVTTIKDKLEVINLNNSIDYRKTDHEINSLFIINDADSYVKLNRLWQDLSYGENKLFYELIIQGRNVDYIKHTDKTVWFDFEQICGGLRANVDYIQLAKTYDKFIISNITALNESDKDKARRFTWLIDILYDEHKTVAIESKSAISQIYVKGDFSNEFQRTISRLVEMSSQDYINNK